MKPDITLIFPDSPFLLNPAAFPPLGILYLSAYLKRCGFSTQCLDMGAGDTLDQVESDYVGVSITTPQRLEAYDIASRLTGKHVIAGGPHATHRASECLANGFDTVLKGYGEMPLASFLSEVHSRGGPLPSMEINDIPFPDRDAIDLTRYGYSIDGKPATPIMTSRGCPYSCSFCGKIDSSFSMQSAERTVQEIEHIHARYGYDAFMIYDDIFVAGKRRLSQMAEMLEGRYTFRCFARTNLITPEVCESLARLGVYEVGLGVESGSDVVLSRNMKGTTRKQNRDAVVMLHGHGIRAKAFLIVGLPGESDETIMDTVDWIEAARPDDLDVSILQPMPGSRIFEDPHRWDLSFSYNGTPGWYKGKPGEYHSTVSTTALDAESIVAWRDLLEEMYKPQEYLK